MLITDKATYSSNIYYAIVVNTSSSDDPDTNASDRVQIYIPSMQYEYADRYEEYMSDSNKSSNEDFSAYPWATTLVSGLSVGDVVYGSHIDNDSGKYIILGIEGGQGTTENNDDSDNDDNDDSGDTNDLSSSKLMDLIMPVIMYNEVGISDLSAWGKDTIASSYYKNITLHDGKKTDCWAIGLIQWNGARAFDTLYKCCKASGDKWKDDLPSNDNLYKDIKSAIKAGSASKYRTKYCYKYNPAKGGALYKGIEKILGYSTSKKTQKELATASVSDTVDMLKGKGVDNPAILIYLADLMNQYGTGLDNTVKAATKACKRTKLNYMQQLDLVVDQVKTFATYSDYKTRRNFTYTYINNLYKKGKLTSLSTDKTNEGGNSSGTGTYALPTAKLYNISLGYHEKYSSGKPHRGVDFKCPSGTKLYACTDGTIESFDMPHKSTTYSDDDQYWYGNFCVIHADDGNHILYCHMKKTAKKKGKIKKGDFIGYSDNTGNSKGAHLHFEVRKAKKFGNEIDPMPFLGLSSTGKKLSTTTSSSSSTKGNKIVEYAKNYLGCKYVHGAEGPNTFDCSGLTSYVYKHFGYKLHRVSDDQARYDGKSVTKSQLQAGDLVFFTYNASHWKKIGHVGIYVGDNKFIHAPNPSTVVKITSLSSSYYKKRYVMAKRII